MPTHAPSGWLVVLVWGCITLPGETTIDFEFQFHTEEDPDSDDDGEHADGTEGRIDGNGADDIGGEQELQTKQDRPADRLAVAAVLRFRRTTMPVPQVKDRGVEHANDNDGNPRRINRLPHPLYGFRKRHVHVSSSAVPSTSPRLIEDPSDMSLAAGGSTARSLRRATISSRRTSSVGSAARVVFPTR